MRAFAQRVLWSLGMLGIGILCLGGLYVSAVIVVSKQRNAEQQRYDELRAR